MITLSRKTKYLLLGMGSLVPGYWKLPLLSKAAPMSTGGTDSARYCYSVWLRHLVKAYENGLSTTPRIVAELGPGDSIGVGMAALLTGVDAYYAFDVVDYQHTGRNAGVFDELVGLFHKREPIPSNEEFPGVRPILSSYAFPSHILSNAQLQAALSKQRTDRIRWELVSLSGQHQHIFYAVPWDKQTVVKPNSIDMVFSQAVLEHVTDLEGTYCALFTWLKPGGVMSHQIDFECHGCADTWNGHWSYAPFTWRIMNGSRLFLINRVPCGGHLSLLKKSGFDVVYELRATAPSQGIDRSRLASGFQQMSDDDLQTSGVFLQARKSL